jgi:GxxExxY protein
MRLPIRRLSQNEFGDMAFHVMRHVFAIHNDIGRFFDERIYKQELAFRMPEVRSEVPIDIKFESFCTTLFIDTLVGDGGVIEFKSVESLSGQHRAQLLQYLLLCNVAHGKLINVRPEEVEHEFVNTQWHYEDRLRFQIQSDHWNPRVPGASELREFILALLRDLGTGLEISLYEKAVAHCFGEKVSEEDIRVVINGRQAGYQRFRLIAPGVAIKITALDGGLDAFENHARRLLARVSLHAIAWININLKKVTFTMLER